jgi:hypothetical protein
MRKFNVTGLCVPERNYMVDISEKIEKIFAMVEDGSYFTINRGRQYGKTTTINLLKKRLPKDYICASISFQGAKKDMFEDEANFCQALLKRIQRSLLIEHKAEAQLWIDNSITDIDLLDDFITERCTGKKIVLIIDEADAASNNNIFITFISMLREKYLMRNAGEDFTFHSVILAGVYDIRNLKQKMVLSGHHTISTGESHENSPWNIAVDFKVDMSFSAKEIETMLVEYENDHHTGMNISEIAQEIRNYTSGYPYLVSRICMLIDTELDRNWTLDGVREAIKLMLEENYALLEYIVKKIDDNEELSNLLFDMTVGNKKYNYNTDVPVIKTGLMFGILAKGDDGLQIHNKIFEIRIANYFISKNSLKWRENVVEGSVNEIIKGNVFNMELCLNKFKEHYEEIYTDKDENFFERNGKLIFLTYIKPLLNGAGFYHFEPQTNDGGKMDLVIDYDKQQFILEIKRWYGNSKHQDAYEQLANYLKSKNTGCGYLLTFDFRKTSVKTDNYLSQWIEYDGKQIFDVVVKIGKNNG